MFSIHKAASIFYYTGRGKGGHELLHLDGEPQQGNAGYYLGDPSDGVLSARAVWAGGLAESLGLKPGSAVGMHSLAALWYGYAPDGATPLNDRVPTFAKQSAAQRKVAAAEVELFTALRDMGALRANLKKMGISAKDMKLRADIQEQQSKIDSAKEKLTSAQNDSDYRSTAHDLTFSAPKSVSIAWAALLARSLDPKDPDAAEAGRIAKAIQDSVALAARNVCVNLIEPDLVFTRHRNGSDKARQYENVKGLAFALVQHFESRPTLEEAASKAGVEKAWRKPDPQLHVHALLMALGQDHDDEVRAIWTRFLSDNAASIGAAFRAELASMLRQQGFDLRQSKTDSVDAFEIAGITDKQIGAFSNRRASVSKSIAEGKSGQKAVLAERHAKKDYSTEDMLADWAQRLDSTKVNIDIKSLHGNKAATPTRDRTSLIDAAINHLMAMTAEIRLTDISRVANELAQHATAAELNGLTPIAWAKELAKEIIGHPTMVVGDSVDKHGRPVFTSTALMDRERRLYFGQVSELQRQPRADSFTPNDAAQAITAAEQHLAKTKNEPAFAFAQFQKELVESLLVEKQSIRVAIAPAGCGKTTAALAACNAFEGRGMRVFPIAPSNKAAQVLAKDLQKQESDGLTPQKMLQNIEAGRVVLSSTDVLFVDEASMLDFDTAEALVKAALEAKGGPARLILMGDTEQLPSVGRGNFFRRLVEDNERAAAAGHEVSIVYRVLKSEEEWAKIARQKKDIGKQATALLALRKNQEALSIYDSLGAIKLSATREDAMSELVADAIDSLATPAQGLRAAVGKQEIEAAVREFQRSLRSISILASTRADVSRLNTLAREELESMGYYDKAGGQRASLSRGKVGHMEIRQGDRIIFTDPAKASVASQKSGAEPTKSRIAKSTCGVVRRIERKLNTVNLTVELDGGEPRTIATLELEDFSGIDFAFATTVHKAQGATVERTYELFGTFAARELDYVAKSRYREQHQIYGAKHEFESYQRAIGRTTQKIEAIDVGMSDLSAFAHTESELDALRQAGIEAHAGLSELAANAKAARLRHMTQGKLVEIVQADGGSEKPSMQRVVIEIAGRRRVFEGVGLLDDLSKRDIKIGAHVGLEALSPMTGSPLSGVRWRWHTQNELRNAGLLADLAMIESVAAGAEGTSAGHALERARNARLSGKKSSLMTASETAAIFRSEALRSFNASADLIDELVSVAQASAPTAAEEALLDEAREWLPLSVKPGSRAALRVKLEEGGIFLKKSHQISGSKTWIAHQGSLAFCRNELGGIEAWPIARLPTPIQREVVSSYRSLDNIKDEHADALKDGQAAAAEVLASAGELAALLKIEAISHPEHGLSIFVGASPSRSFNDYPILAAMFADNEKDSTAITAKIIPSLDRGIAIKNLKTHQGFDMEAKGFVFPIEVLERTSAKPGSGAREDLRAYFEALATLLQSSRGEGSSTNSTKSRKPKEDEHSKTQTR